MQVWQRNLLVIWISQFASLLGFGMGLPFAPYYIQTLGVPAADVAWWSGMFWASAFLPLAIMGPIWGMLADRYGRKPMLLRANFCAAGIIAMMGVVTTVEQLIVLRVLQGALSGTMTAAITMVVTSTPENRHGVAMGWLNAAAFSGMTTAAFLGGWLADAVGYRVTFFISGGLLVIAGSTILFFVHEQFVPPVRAVNTIRQRWSERLAMLGPSLPILTIMLAIAAVQRFDTALLPLLVQELRGGELEGSASVTGSINGLAAIGAMISGIYFGRLADRLHPARVGQITSLGAGAFMLAIGLSTSFPVIFAARFGMYFFAGGMDPLFQAWLARSTPEARRGTVMGLTVTARSIGWMIAPLASAWVAEEWSLRSVFLIGPLLFWLLIPLIGVLARHFAEPAIGVAAEESTVG